MLPLRSTYKTAFDVLETCQPWCLASRSLASACCASRQGRTASTWPTLRQRRNAGRVLPVNPNSQARYYVRSNCFVQTRSFHCSSRWNVNKTIQQIESRNRTGPFSWKAGVLFLITGAGMIVYFRNEKARMERKRIAEATKGIGKPKVGGEFDLIDHNGNRFTSKDMLGKYALVYFGFTHCPDICPEELDKMAVMYDLVKAKSGNTLRPIFITCDPARDQPSVIKEYLKEFHPEFLGLTGTYEQIKDVCKAYRVYFSTPPDLKPGQDYLVDHSIYFFLMDPEGDFVEALGKNFTAQQAAKIISDHIGDWRGRLDKD